MSEEVIGPLLKASQQLHEEKYRDENESFYEAMCRIAAVLSDDEAHRKHLKEVLLPMKFLPAGRIQASVGKARKTAAHNCFVSQTIHDSMDSIMDAAKSAAQTMRLGGGIGYDFSRIRPEKDRIVTLDSSASGPVSFMEIFDSLCKTILSAGHRRGAMMGVLRVDHPDIETFIRAKQKKGALLNFNISVGITDDFIKAVVEGDKFPLVFGGRVYKMVDARGLFDEIMRSNWDWAEPGVLFLDRINEQNNLHYLEKIEATNPCAEQPLPPNGACLLGSFNLTKYVAHSFNDNKKWVFNFEEFRKDIPPVIRMMDNVIDYAVYPLPEQEVEAKSKRRMGIGVAGLANAGEAVAGPYGSPEFLTFTKAVLGILRDTSYITSVSLAIEKGAFPAFDRHLYSEGDFLKTLPEDIQEDVFNYGIRNSHLLSIAPTGTISFCADNISSGIEPVFAHTVDRIIQSDDGPRTTRVRDYGSRVFAVDGLCADKLSVDAHLSVLVTAQGYVDSSVSKTINVGSDVTFDEFKTIYLKAWKLGAKGCTTYREAGKRFGILKRVDEEAEPEGTACFVDPATGKKECE